MGWKAIARSAPGTSHLKQGLPCQDFGGYRVLNEVIVGAVADGAGSAKYAERGAQVSVKVVLDYLGGIEAWLQRRRPKWQFWRESMPAPSLELMDRLFIKMLARVCAALEKEAQRNQHSVDDLACTLLVFIATPRWVAAMQVGDGFIVTRSGREPPRLLFPPDKGEYVNETTFVTSKTAFEAMKVAIEHQEAGFICASTDGVERLAIKTAYWQPFAPFFEPLETYLRETATPEQDAAYLVNFLESERLNARTDDDKTLLLCLYEQSDLPSHAAKPAPDGADRQ